MSHLFLKVIKQAVITFDRSNSAKLLTNFNALKELVDQLTLSDIGLNIELVSEESFNKPYKAPCTFVGIFKNNQIAMSVFILRGDYRMPLHDHPIMHGLLKVLSGKILIQSFSKIDKDDDTNASFDNESFSFDVTKEFPLICDSSSSSAILTPTEKNFHEITAVNNVAAFFDILSPPYDANIPIYGRRPCNFYSKRSLQPSNATNDSSPIWNLEKIPAPDTYYCDTGYYKKPAFLFDYNDETSESEEN